MTDYLVNCQNNSPLTTTETVAFSVQIARDGDQIANFNQGFPSVVSDINIRNELIRRIQEFIKVDSGVIAEVEVEERANAIADSIDGHIETV